MTPQTGMNEPLDKSIKNITMEIAPFESNTREIKLTKFIDKNKVVLKFVHPLSPIYRALESQNFLTN